MECLDKELNATKEAALLETKLSSLVWICTSTHAASIVTVIDANNPAEILNSFGVCANHLLCIASVPGANSSDYVNNENVTKDDKSKPEEVKVETDEQAPLPIDSQENDPEALVGQITFVEHNESVFNKKDQVSSREQERTEEEQEEESPSHEIMSSVLATMWLGAQNGMLFVHSAVANWNQCLHSVKLNDAVLSVV